MVVPPVLTVEKVTPELTECAQAIRFSMVLTCAVGLTVMVKLSSAPEQLMPLLVKVGVTTMVDIIGDVPLLIAAKPSIFPVPLSARPV